MIKIDITITKAFYKIIDKLGREPNKIWVDKGSEFFKRSMKSWPILKRNLSIMKENLLLLRSFIEKAASTIVEGFQVSHFDLGRTYQKVFTENG